MFNWQKIVFRQLITWLIASEMDWHWDGLIDFPAFGRSQGCWNNSEHFTNISPLLSGVICLPVQMGKTQQSRMSAPTEASCQKQMWIIIWDATRSPVPQWPKFWSHFLFWVYRARLEWGVCRAQGSTNAVSAGVKFTAIFLIHSNHW